MEFVDKPKQTIFSARINWINLFKIFDEWLSTINNQNYAWSLDDMTGSKHSCIYSIHGLLSVYPFLLRDIWSPGSISSVYHSFFHFLRFKITNKSSRCLVVPIASIQNAHSQFSVSFIKACFSYFENTTLELLPILNIYLFSSIL